MEFTMNNFKRIPKVGLGTWELTDREILLKSLECAYSTGYRHIDTAKVYNNESIIGEFLVKVPREDIFLTSKLWIDDIENVEAACDLSLKNLQTNYLDLYLVHWPLSYKGEFNILKVWRQMENLVNLNKVRSIGICNFGPIKLTTLLSICKIKPAVLQIETHPYLPQTQLVTLCERENIIITSYSTLGSSNINCKLVREDPVIMKLAKKHKCEPTQILLSNAVTRNQVVIPRSSNEAHIKSNFQLIDLTREDIDEIDSITDRCRYVDMTPKFGLDCFE